MKYLKEQFKDLIPYTPTGHDEGIYLNANEAFYDTPYEIKKYISNYIMVHNLNRYPDDSCEKVKKAIARRYGVSEKNVAVGVGSDDLLDILLRSTASSKKVLSLDPSFSMYALLTKINEGEFVKIPLNEDFTCDIGRVREAVLKEKPIVTFLCNPNNPTGSAVSSGELEKVISLRQGIVAVDEAYEDFFNDSCIPLIEKYANLCVLRTFSKAYALASIRFGYAIADREIIEMIDTVRSPYIMNTISQEIAACAMDNHRLYREKIKETIALREYLYKELKFLGIEVWPSHTNFLYMVLSPEQKAKMQENHVYLRYLGDYTRVTVGTKEEMDIFLQILKEERSQEKIS
ncbi:MAG: histidinol-phosphate transaminase [Fusobacteriaceae bacterium]|jgi:histidinol-phosphate aminotransferase|nr:histidinol-phosphate transaminase [Fusobacteriaceae bacterium]